VIAIQGAKMKVKALSFGTVNIDGKDYFKVHFQPRIIPYLNNQR
jgi:hypothetical protein